MSNLWQCLEALAGGKHVAAAWAELAGEQFPPLRSAFLRDTQTRARLIPCPHGCGCEHEICERKNGALVALCRCEPSSCDDFAVTAEQAMLLQLNTAKLGRAVAKAFDCDARTATLPMPLTWQIGAKFSNAVPVLLTIQNNRESFRHVVAELSARQRQRFILFVPTSRLLDAASRELMETAKAGIFDLESNLNISDTGNLSAKSPPGKLFQAFAPDAGEPIPETVAAQVFALVEKLDSKKRYKHPSPLTVFRLYFGRGLNAQAVADKCGCVKSTVLNRRKLILKETKKTSDELRAFSPYFNPVEKAITDSRAAYIHRKTLVHDVGEPEDESE